MCCDSRVDRAGECVSVQVKRHIYGGEVPGSRVIRLHAIPCVILRYFPHLILVGGKPISWKYPLDPSNSADLDHTTFLNIKGTI